MKLRRGITLSQTFNVSLSGLQSELSLLLIRYLKMLITYVAFALEELGIDYSSDIIEWNIYSTIAYAAVHHNDEYLKNKRKNETLTSKELNQYLTDNYSKEDGTVA